MAKNKTAITEISVYQFIETIKDEIKKKDSLLLVRLLEQQTGLAPKMWGPSIIGFGSYHYQYESGREGDSPLVGFSPRSTALVLYLSGNFENRENLLLQLGRHKTEKGCIYIKKLEDIQLDTLQLMIANHIKHIQQIYPDKK